VAYFRLRAASDTDLVGGYTSTFQTGATLSTTGPPICEPGNTSVTLNGTTGHVTTSLAGPAGITGSSSIAGWVNLAELPTQVAAVPSAGLTLAPGATTTVPLVFNWPVTATRVSPKFSLNATDASGSSYPLTQTVTVLQ